MICSRMMIMTCSLIRLIKILSGEVATWPLLQQLEIPYTSIYSTSELLIILPLFSPYQYRRRKSGHTGLVVMRGEGTVSEAIDETYDKLVSPKRRIIVKPVFVYTSAAIK